MTNETLEMDNLWCKTRIRASTYVYYDFIILRSIVGDSIDWRIDKILLRLLNATYKI